jgi:hypothetical protein
MSLVNRLWICNNNFRHDMRSLAQQIIKIQYGRGVLSVPRSCPTITGARVRGARAKHFTIQVLPDRELGLTVVAVVKAIALLD